MKKPHLIRENLIKKKLFMVLLLCLILQLLIFSLIHPNNDTLIIKSNTSQNSIGTASLSSIAGNFGTNVNIKLAFTNSSATATISTDALDFSIPVPTDQWGLSFTNLTFSNLYAPNISKYIQRTVAASSSLYPYKHMGFNITNYCTLQNFSVYIYADTVSGSVSYNVLGRNGTQSIKGRSPIRRTSFPLDHSPFRLRWLEHLIGTM